MTDQFATLDATAQAELVRRGDVQPSELVEAAIERALKETDRQENAGRKVELDQPITDPHVKGFVEAMGGVARAQKISVMPTYEHKSAAELVDLMSPQLAEQINEYATAHGYPTVDAPVLV